MLALTLKRDILHSCRPKCLFSQHTSTTSSGTPLSWWFVGNGELDALLKKVKFGLFNQGTLLRLSGKFNGNTVLRNFICKAI